jgi:hypothetical protein
MSHNGSNISLTIAAQWMKSLKQIQIYSLYRYIQDSIILLLMLMEIVQSSNFLMVNYPTSCINIAERDL